MELRQDVKMTQKQQLVMTPRLQQALKLLELTTLDLAQLVQQELVGNPALEVEEGEEGEETEERAEAEAEKAEEEPDVVEAQDQPDLEDYLPEGADGEYHIREEREPMEERYERAISTSVSLRDHLEDQLQIASNDPEVNRIGDFIIGSLDERGYLTTTVEEIAQSLAVAVETVVSVLRLVQEFDPPGIAARDLRECLLLQLAADGEGEGTAARIVRDHLEDVLQKRFVEIARRTHLPQREVEKAVERIGELDPKPGYRFATEPPPHITPDLLVERIDDEFITTLNDRDVPRLRISRSYQQVLRDARQRKDGSREFLAKKMDAARWLLDIIEQRRRTMLKVMRDIVEYQHDFFEHGLAHLKPMTLNQVAERIGMHESTVSRVTRGKYVQTPHGVFELKYFFSPALRTDGGGEVSARKVRQRLQEIINGEDAHRPLSDQQLVELLKAEGYQVARRTVAKYRDQLQILPARMRRQP
jgi:RNA polymerase sigma-54 factor